MGVEFEGFSTEKITPGDQRPIACEFCKIAHKLAPADIVHDWVDYNCLAIVPLNPVTPGHILVLPKEHLRNAVDNPERTATVMFCAADWIARTGVGDCNIITSVGKDATQTIFHLHVHVVPRRAGDGLALPWTKKFGDN